MLRHLKILAITLSVLGPVSSFAAQAAGKHFDRAIFVIFENTNYSKALAQPFFKHLAQTGANFTNLVALTHPSQGNYVALTAGSLFGVTDDRLIDLNVPNIIDLLEAKGVSWKVYAEDFPGACFTGKSRNQYVRKHNPFISFRNIQDNPERCAKIVNANDFDRDAASGSLPDYVFYIPGMRNDGHDTGVAFADNWYSGKFGHYVEDAKFMERTVLISTFDENGGGTPNQIYTSFVGGTVKPGENSSALNIYSLLALIEENWDLGDLGQKDQSAPKITDIWK